MKKNQIIKRTDKIQAGQIQAKQIEGKIEGETKREIQATQIELPIKKHPSLKELEEGVFHDGEKILYTTPPDTEWNCCCIKGDKDLCVFIFKCGVMSSVLAFCFFMLMNGKSGSEFYVSTLSLILGGVMSGTDTTEKKEQKSKNK